MEGNNGKNKKGTYTAAATEDDEFQHVDDEKAIMDRYLKAEFSAMDTDKDGMLTPDEFVKLLMFLGYGGGDSGKELLKAVNKDKNTVITLDEYYDAMKRSDVVQKTNGMRFLFQCFDDNKDGKARKDQIEEGFARMQIELDEEMKRDIANMDENHDGIIAYEEFVHSQLKKKNYVSS